MDPLKFCCRFSDLDFVYSNCKVIQYLRFTIAFKLVLSQSSQILLPLCNPAIPSLAVSCFGIYRGVEMIYVMYMYIYTCFSFEFCARQPDQALTSANSNLVVFKIYALILRP